MECKAFKKCGGCQLSMSYEQQLEYKQQKANRLLSRFCRVEPIVGAENDCHYRNKVQTVYKTARSGAIVSGVFRSSDKGITVIDGCRLEDRRASAVIAAMRPLMGSFRINPYNPVSGKGVLRHTLVRVGSKGTMVVLVVNKAAVPGAKGFAKELAKRCSDVKSVVLNVNPNGMPLTLGKQSSVLFGVGYAEDELCGCTFRISPAAFYQVNSAQTEKLYAMALDAAEITHGTRLIDAYCGTGTIGILCEKRGALVAGCEINSSAVKDARVNAKINGCKNITFFERDAGEFMKQLAEDGEKVDAVMMDPPRAGASKAFLEAVAALMPKRVVYISCGIDTLARDLRILEKYGYKTKKIQPVDMFPHTTGIETVVSLSPV
ncbi:MAG: 23S rRNA (uracil(1939)-C(5))-methyltransferase RlmD [Ruminococcus sp.]|nr:23S rRNA (uracil(1939)-C(5))-methyltransferase RlmD [Ruminococcus sp.]